MKHSRELSEFQSWVNDRLEDIGLSTTTYELEKNDVTDQPAYGKTLVNSPAVLRSGPNVVGELEGTGGGESTLLFAHADKSSTAYRYTRDHAPFNKQDSQLVGPGIADDISGVSAILSAIEVVTDADNALAGDLIVGSILGKQLGILGTYGLVRKFGPAENAIYVHPAESEGGLRHLKIGSNGIIEFEIRIDGKPPDTTEPTHTPFAESGINPIDKGQYIVDGLSDWIDEATDQYSYEPLKELTGKSVEMLVGQITGGLDNGVNKVPSNCTVRGTVTFPPGVSLDSIKQEFVRRFSRLVKDDPWLAESNTQLQWGDYMADSATTPEDSAFVRRSADAIERITEEYPTFYYGHTSSDIRYPSLYWNADAFGFGPRAGRMGSPDEWIDTQEYLDTIAALSSIITDQ